MSSMREWVLRLLGTWRPGRDDADLEEELRCHLELANEHERRLPEPSAPIDHRRAPAHTVTMSQAMESVRDQRGLPSLEDLGRDLRQSVRALRRTPTFSLVTIVTLALAIAVNAAVFTVLNGILLKPLPYPQPDQLVAVWHAAPGAPGLAAVSGDLRLSASMFFTYAEHNRAFQSLGVWGVGTGTVTDGEPEQVRAVAVSDGTLQALGVRPLLGRWLEARDQAPNAPRVVLLTYGYWQRRFAGDPLIVGRTITLDSTTREIVGVMPKGFRIVDADAELIDPVRFDRRVTRLPGFGWQCVARLKPGVSIAEANADIARLVPVWMTSWPAAPGVNQRIYESWRITPAIRPLEQDIVGTIGRTLWVLMGTAGMVLLIGCANVATLVMVRTEDRQQELAIRSALGAGRGRIVRALGIEALILAGAAAIIGAAIAKIGVSAIVAYAPATLPRVSQIALGSREGLFTIGIAILSSLLFGLIPALKRRVPQVSAALGTAGRTFTETRGRQRARNILIVAQLALAVVLLVSSGLMLRTFRALHAVRPGFKGADQQLTVRLSIPQVLVPEPDRVGQLQRDLIDKLSGIPGVTSAAMSTAIPMEGLPEDWDVIEAEGGTYRANEIPPLRVFKSVSPGAFKTAGTQLVAGRDFDWADLAGRHHVVIVSQNLARELWGSATSAVGKRVQVLPNAPLHQVVGVVQDVFENGVDVAAPTIVYWPLFGTSPYRADNPRVERVVTLMVRSPRAGSEALVKDVQQAVWSVNPSLAVASVRTMQEIFDRSIARTSFTLATLLMAGSMALALGIIGVYGLVSYAVSRRTREIGIRLALGAPAGALVARTVRSTLVLAAVAIPIGLAASAGLTRLMSSLLFGVNPLDLPTYTTVAAVLMIAAIAASYIPARRVTAVDPVRTLNAQ